MNHAVVTGANGFIGVNLIKGLLENNVKVTAILRPNSKYKGVFESHPLLSMVYSESTNYENLATQISAPDIFYHLAWSGVNGAEKADCFLQTENLLMALNAAKAAKVFGCTKFISVGTITESAALDALERGISSPSVVYGISKSCSHKILQMWCNNNNLNFVWARLANTFGENNGTGNLLDYTINCLNKGESPTFSSADQVYDFLYIKDCVKALYLLGKENTSESTYYVGSGYPRLLKDFLITAGQIINPDIPLIFGVRPNDGMVWDKRWFDISKIRQDVGFEPEYSFEEALEAVLLK